MNQRLSRRSSWSQRLALVLASLGFMLVATELVLRQSFPVRGMIYALDDRYLFRHIPGSRKLENAAGHVGPRVLVRINEAGRRGNESASPRAATRVVVYGDSFIAAEYAREPDTYVAQLERLLDGRAQVLNAGVTGYGVDQESLRMEDDLLILRPDLVIVAAYAGNDFGDLLRNKLYRLDTEGRITANRPVIGDALRREFQAPFEMSSIQIVRAVQSMYQQRARRRPAPAERAARVVDPTAVRLANRKSEYEEFVVRGDNVVRNLLADEYDADVSLEPASPSASYRVRLMDQVIERIQETTSRAGVPLLLLIIPERSDVSGTGGPAEARRRYPGYRPTGLTDALETVAGQRGVRYLNLFNPFQQNGGADLYYPLDDHWNERGQELAARLSADLVRASLRRPLTGQEKPGSATRR